MGLLLSSRLQPTSQTACQHDRGEPAMVARAFAPQPCIRSDPVDPDHEAADALRLRGSGTVDPFSVRHGGHALTRAPPPRIRGRQARMRELAAGLWSNLCRLKPQV